MRVNMAEIKCGDVFKRYERYLGTTTFVCMESLKQSKGYKNEYLLYSTVLSSTGDFYTKLDEVYVTTIRKYGKVGHVEKIGVWKNGKIEYIK